MKNSFLTTLAAILYCLHPLIFAQDTTLTITNTGNVGIGTTNPSEKLQINDFTQPGPLYLKLATNGVNEPPLGPKYTGLKLRHFSESYGFTLESIDIAGTSAGEFHIKSHFDDPNGITRLMIHRVTGNVGIGTTDPGRLLQIGTSASSSVGIIRVGHNHGPSFREWDFGIGDATLFGHYDNFGFSDNSGGTIMILEATGQGGSVGINTLTPDQRLSVNGNASKVGGGSWATFSDIRMKQDINPFTDGLSILKQINPITFRYNGKLGYPTDDTYVGVIAQEIQSIAPYTIGTFRTKLAPEDEEETDVLQFDGSSLIYIAINAIQELDAKIEQLNKLQKENENLSSRLRELENIVKSLTADKLNSDNDSMTALKR